MHIPDGILNPYICILMYIVAFGFLIWAWKGIKRTLPRTFAPLVAIVAAVLVLVQLFEFPVAGGGSTWHVMGGTLVTMILGPEGGVISMTITLVFQALVLGDGGLSSFGANVFNMAVIGGLSFFLVKILLNRHFSSKRLAYSLFIASWASNVLTALSVGIEIGIYPLAGQIGGLSVTVPAMLFWYGPTGLVEAVLTSSIVVSLSKTRSIRLHGLEMLQNDNSRNSKINGGS
jgi:cobalt/nickel transport system permease protein